MFSFRLCSHTVWGIRVLVDYRKVLTQVWERVYVLTTAAQYSERYWDLVEFPRSACTPEPLVLTFCFIFFFFFAMFSLGAS